MTSPNPTPVPFAHCPDAPELLDVKAVAGLLTCSPRTVYRLTDAAKMPPLGDMTGGASAGVPGRLSIQSPIT